MGPVGGPRWAASGPEGGEAYVRTYTVHLGEATNPASARLRRATDATKMGPGMDFPAQRELSPKVDRDGGSWYDYERNPGEKQKDAGWLPGMFWDGRRRA